MRRIHEALIRSHERIPPASWREVRAVIAGVALCLLVVNAAALWFLAHHSPDRGPRVIKTKWRLLDEADGATNWLILGDSSGLRGVVPKLLDARLGGRSVNLCTTRRMLVTSDAWMLDRFIVRHGPPQGVLLLHTYEVWHGDREWLISAMPDIPLAWGFWDRMNPPFPLQPMEQFRVFLSRYVPLYADNQSLARAFQYPWKVARYFFSIGVDDTGYMPIKSASPRQVEEDRQLHIEAVRGQRFDISEINRQALERIRELAETRGFDVYLANSPLYQGLADDPDFRAYFRQVQDALRAFAATSPRIHYIAQEPWTFPKDQMENCDHVTAVASQEFTRKLAEEIVQIRANQTASDKP